MSIRVHQNCLDKVDHALQRNNCPTKKYLADELQIARSTLYNFTSGQFVAKYIFLKISERLGLNWQDIADFDNIGNSIPSGEEQERFSIERPTVEEIHQQLENPGALVRITAPRGMGKTSLIAGTILKFAQQGYQTVYLNFGLAEQNDFTDLECFLKWFCGSVGNKLKLENQFDNPEFWDENLSNKLKCSNYFEQYLLAQLKTPLILGLDDIHRIFPYQAIASEYLSLLRVWHEEARSNQVWQQLRLVLAYPPGIDIPLPLNESPFNVGYCINLPEFQPKQL